jgi:hypothetical protein
MAEEVKHTGQSAALFTVSKLTHTIFFLICVVGGGSKVHSTLRALNGLLCQPRVIMIIYI